MEINPILKQNQSVLTIHSLVASINLECTVDLRFLASVCRNIEYSPRKIPCAILRIKEPRMSALIFSNGRIVLTGGKSEISARLATRYIARYIQIMGHPTTTYSAFKIFSMTCVFDTQFGLNLNSFISAVGSTKATISDRFGYCNYRHSPDVTVILFESGKVVFKSSSRQAITQSLTSIYPILVNSRSLHLK